MKSNLTEIIFLLDRSGSMSGLEGDTIGGFNGFVKSQRDLGETLITTVLFDDKYEILHNGTNARDVVLSENDYFVRGRTALLDAIGKTILDVGNRLTKTPETNRPGKVIFVITTDGLENASREFSYSKINEMITHQKEKYNWDFIFMAANIDVASEGAKIGITEPELCMAYIPTADGTEAMFMETCACVAEMRTPAKATNTGPKKRKMFFGR